MPPRATAQKTKPRPPLDDARTLDAAFFVLAKQGLEGLTMRRIADRLAVQNPALYWHFRNKQAIVDRMAERLLDEVVNEARASAIGNQPAWRELLLTAARAFRRVMRAYNDGARLVAAANLSQSPTAPLFAEALELLVAAGFAERDALIGIIAVFDYTLGATFEEQEDPLRGAQPQKLPRRSSTPKPAPKPAPWHSAIERIAAALGQDGEVVFEGGLGLLLDGLERRVRTNSRAAKRA